MLQLAGIALNVVGLSLTIYGIVRESQQRRAPLLRPREAALLLRARRLIGRGPKPVTVQFNATLRRMEGAGHMVVLTSRRPSDPIEDQFNTVEANFDAKLAGLERKAERDDELQGRRIAATEDEQARLASQLADLDQTERTIASGALRIELVGVAMALLGTTLSAIG